MSGGHYQYLYFNVNMFCDQLEKEIKNNKRKNEWGEVRDYNDTTIDELKKILALCRKTSNLMKDVEWLYSGDDGEETFLENIK